MKEIDDRMSIVQASAECNFSIRTGQSWLHMLSRTGNNFQFRVRKSIPGIMSLEHQEVLQIIIGNNRMARIKGKRNHCVMQQDSIIPNVLSDK